MSSHPKFFHIGESYQLLNFLGYDGICNLYYVEKVPEEHNTPKHELYLLREFLVEKFPTVEHCEAFWQMEEKCDQQLKDSPHSQNMLILHQNIKFEAENGRTQFFSLYEYAPEFINLKDWFLRDKYALEMDIDDIIKEIIIPICYLIEDANAKGIVHRDLNFSSIYIQTKKDLEDLTTIEGKLTFVPIISTWRTACIRTYEQISQIPPSIEELEDGGDVIRTPGFFAPEIAMGKKAGIFSDIYEMGAVIYFLATNGATRPREESVDDFILDAAEKNHDIEPELNNIIKRCTQFEPHLRYKSFADLIQDLNAFINKQFPVLEYLKRYQSANVVDIGLIFQIPKTNFTGFIPFYIEKMIQEENGYFRIGQDLFKNIPEIEGIVPLSENTEQFVIAYSNQQDIFTLYEGRNKSPTCLNGKELIHDEWTPYHLGQPITIQKLHEVTFAIGEKPPGVKTIKIE